MALGSVSFFRLQSYRLIDVDFPHGADRFIGFYYMVFVDLRNGCMSFFQWDNKHIIERLMRSTFITVLAWTYQHLTKPILFLFPPEIIHEVMTSVGEAFGEIGILRWMLHTLFSVPDRRIVQTIAGIQFQTPVGLSAGFDYEAKLTQILPSLGFGFQTVGTITNGPYGGNPPPMLGRLPKSRSLMVNKGFKNMGIAATLQKLTGKKFQNAVGISIGRTNTPRLETVTDSIGDICEAFTEVERSTVPFAYYELNISCPNLFGNISFYPPKNLRALLTAMQSLRLSKPLFIKMPIELSNSRISTLFDVIVKYPVAGVIFGNLQKNRKDPSFNQEEVKRFPVGNFSGKPTEARSNELVRLAYKRYGKKLVVIGCGGIFTAEDAYRKMRLGASLVQLITGMIYVGPQLVSQINSGISELLQKDGYSHVSEIIGKDA